MMNWSRFHGLPGADTENFEKLCRGVIRRHFGNLGTWHELKNQPGVEFYITLNEDNSILGRKNNVIGWQNKWFEYKANGELTRIAKKQIEHSLEKTREHVSQITHWILWTHKTLAKCDQEWYYALEDSYSFSLQLWNQDDLDELLSGAAIDLRNTYFGELALTNEMLLEQHEKSIAPIRDRWLHDVHQEMDAEKQIRKILGEKQAWDKLESTSVELNEVSDVIKSSLVKPEYSRWKKELDILNLTCQTLANHCDLFRNGISGDDIENVKTTLRKVDTKVKLEINKTLTQLRTNNLSLSLIVTNALAYIRDAKKMFRSASELLTQQLITVIADAGGGKTQLSAELTAPSQDRPAGILILGRTLKKNMTLDEIAQSFTFYQKRVDNFEALISALNSVGQRSSCRLPIVIDGLNEAQDPREWKSILDSILPTLKKYPNVVLICTLRTSERKRESFHVVHRNRHHIGRESLAHNSLPSSAYEILSEGYDEELTFKAIESYFQRYKIKADPFTAPLDFFSHPLNLKIFCEVTNRKAEDEIQVSYFPSSIYSLFREQIKHTVSNIVNMINLDYRYKIDDVEKAIYYLGECFWESSSRSIEEDTFKQKVNIPNQDWDSDITNLLAQEGLIFRDESEEKFIYELTPVYDRLGGFIIAEYLLGKHSKRNLSEWVTNEKFTESIFGNISDQHPLSEDILHALVVLAPKTVKKHLWKAIPESFRTGAIALSYLIDKEDICNETIENYTSLIVNGGLEERDIERLITLKYAVEHPFNMDFLGKVLFDLSVTNRDLSWTEYLRYQSSNIIGGLSTQIEKVKTESVMNSNIVRLRLMFYAWNLTSTVIDIRDNATELIYLIGKQEPKTLFNLTIQFLNVNDPYVSERLLASSYAVTSYLIDSNEHEELVINFSKNLYRQIFIEDAPNPTTHQLAREYASCTIRKLVSHYPSEIKNFDSDAFKHPFSKIPKREWGIVEKDKDEYSYPTSPFRMDFENYTIGRLIKDRNNYDYSHEGYQRARANILWRVLEIGWNHQQFDHIEQSIESSAYRTTRSRRPKIERYGKKYSWIAYYELAGQLCDKGKLEYWGERFCTDIDPFFPEESEPLEMEKHSYLSDSSQDTHNWITDEKQQELSEILVIHKDNQEWILLDGLINEESNKLDRTFMYHIDTAFISDKAFKAFKDFKDDKKKMNWPDKYTSYDTYCGELYCEELNRYSAETSISVEIGYETLTYEQPDIFVGKRKLIEGGIRERKASLNQDLSVLSSIFYYAWENPVSSRASVRHQVLSPWIVKEIGLSFNSMDFSYRDQDGKIAVFVSHSKGEILSNYRDLVYLRKDLFDSLCKQRGLVLLKHIISEKGHSKTGVFGGTDSYNRIEYITD